jgi:hypothetical protein
MMIEGYPALVLSPLIATAINVMAHVAINHLRRGRNPMMNLLIAFMVGGIALVVISLVILMENPEGRIDVLFLVGMNSGTYAAVGFCYFAFINLNLASLRVRLLREIKSSPKGGMTLEEILGRYDARAVVDARLDRLVDGGQFKRKGEGFVSGPNSIFRRLARLMDLLKRVILGRKMA